MSKRKRLKRKDTKKNYKNAAVYDVYAEEYDKEMEEKNAEIRARNNEIMTSIKNNNKSYISLA